MQKLHIPSPPGLIIVIVFSVVSLGIGLGSSFLYICTLTKRHDRINDGGSNPA